MAYVLCYYDWDWATAEEYFRRALQLNPSYVHARHMSARFLSTTGRHDEALQQLRFARELDPHATILHANEGVILYFARRYDHAISKLRQTLELDPQYSVAHWDSASRSKRRVTWLRLSNR
ncbi:MAG TPA: tetratricopeptide repeat protein [Thermoanaerobaculia bacterium]|nr:tetratricopeptide repeat protein [Thermoanaerobaculia bacterium]